MKNNQRTDEEIIKEITEPLIQDSSNNDSSATFLIFLLLFLMFLFTCSFFKIKNVLCEKNVWEIRLYSKFQYLKQGRSLILGKLHTSSKSMLRLPAFFARDFARNPLSSLQRLSIPQGTRQFEQHFTSLALSIT